MHKGVRPDEHNDVDQMYILFRHKAYDSYGQSSVIYFQCVQLSKHSDEVKDYLNKKLAAQGSRKKGYYK